MLKEGMGKTYSDVNKFVDRPIIPVQNFLRVNSEKIFHPLLGRYNWKNIQVIKEVLYIILF